jgi:crossover junction endodeoxyribonuclease RuvC
MGRASVRKLWAAKLAGAQAGGVSRAKARLPDPISRQPFRGIVLGIDPSLRATGLALVEFVPGRAPLLLRSRTVKVPASRTLAQALAEIHRAVDAFIEGVAVRHVALEQTI